MNRRMIVAGISLGVLLGVAACERKVVLPKKTDEAEKPPTSQETKPTTQELTSGPFKRLDLPNMPLSLKVPASWKVDTDGPVAMVIGPTPYDKATISLSASHKFGFTQQQLDSLVAHSKADAAKQPPDERRAEVRTLSGIQVLERRYFDKQETRPKRNASGDEVMNAKGEPETLTYKPVKWILTAFVPSGDSYLRYELDFLDMDVDQLSADKDFLDKVIQSLQYTGTLPTSEPAK